MTADWASFGGERIISASVQIPAYGLWTAEIGLATSVELPPTSPLVIGGLSMLGTVVRAADFAGARTMRLVAGYGGWRKTVGERAYDLPGGVPALMVLSDLAAEVGEVVAIPIQAMLGNAYTRQGRAPASRTLANIAASLSATWWADNAGVTQVYTPRSGLPILSDFTVIHWEGARGKFTIASESPADWMPGRTFTSATVTAPQRVNFVRHRITGDGVARMEVFANAA